VFAQNLAVRGSRASHCELSEPPRCGGDERWRPSIGRGPSASATGRVYLRLADFLGLQTLTRGVRMDESMLTTTMFGGGCGDAIVVLSICPPPWIFVVLASFNTWHVTAKAKPEA
jgi:hypothetical protein